MKRPAIESIRSRLIRRRLLVQLIDALEASGEVVTKSEFKAALTPSEWAAYEAGRRRDIPKHCLHPSDLKALSRYSVLLRKADFLFHAAERNKSSPKKRMRPGWSLHRQAESAYMSAYEILEQLEPAWGFFDRPVTFAGGMTPDPDPDSAPRLRGSESTNCRYDNGVANLALLSTRLQVLKASLQDLDYPMGPGFRLTGDWSDSEVSGGQSRYNDLDEFDDLGDEVSL